METEEVVYVDDTSSCECLCNEAETEEPPINE